MSGMLILRLILGGAIGYAVIAFLAWLLQERLAFPGWRAAVPDPVGLGLPGERITLTLADGTSLIGWYLSPLVPAASFPGLLWFYGNGENLGTIWPIIRDFRPPLAAVLVVDYPGYGASGGRTTEAGVHAAGAAAYQALTARPGVDPARLYVYGRSLGTVIATQVAATQRTAGLILESPFTSARDMARRHYAFFPSRLLRLRLDNLATIRRVHCPVLVFHGTADGLVPPEMGRRVAAAAPGPVELVLIEGAGHNDTYALGGTPYKRKLAEFVA
ncbi:MAG TPA: alpha/beta hydrolase [Gemmatimonadales bacterium]|nr:alpha/beta hydrolase [Gemmatimonadales bacterium]